MNNSNSPEKTIPWRDYEIDLYYTWPEDDNLRITWNNLVEASPLPNIFLTWEWTKLWWKWFGGKGRLRLLIVRDKCRVAAIAPFHIKSSKIGPGIYTQMLCLVGDGGPVCPDFLGPIIGKDEAPEVAEALGDVILTLAEQWKAVRLSDILPGSPGMGELIGVLDRRCAKDIVKGERAPFLPLPGNYEAFLSSLGARQRETIRRKLRKAKERYTVRLECIKTIDMVDSALEVLLTIFRLSERGKQSHRGFNRADYIGFHADVMRNFAVEGWLRLFMLYFGDLPVAFLYGYQYEGVFYFYQTGYDLNYRKDGAGSLILQSAIERAISEGCKLFEFLRGDEKYKYHFAKGERKSLTVTLWRKRSVTWSIATGWRLVAAMVRKARQGIRKDSEFDKKMHSIAFGAENN